MTRIRLALILYFFVAAHKAAWKTMSKALLKPMVLEIFLTEDS